MADLAPKIAAFIMECPVDSDLSRAAGLERQAGMRAAFPTATSDELTRGIEIALEIYRQRGAELAAEAEALARGDLSLSDPACVAEARAAVAARRRASNG